VLFALEILGLQDNELKKKLEEYRENQKQSVLEKSKRLKEKIKKELG
jgi:phosphoribosylcarboxyaminoimidazole (NCAIR) mutase